MIYPVKLIQQLKDQDPESLSSLYAAYGRKIYNLAYRMTGNDDPSVGLNIWEAENRAAFDKAFAPHREFYSEVMEITPVITAQEAQKILIEQKSS